MIYFVRHAHANWSLDEQRPLSEKGQADAELVADKLEKLSIQAIYSSPFLRARQTIEPLAARLGLKVNEHPDLRERRLSAVAVDDFESSVKMLWENPTFAYVGGESNIDAQERGIAVLRLLMQKHPSESIVMATHGNLLALILQHFDSRIGFPFWHSMSMPDIYALDVVHGQIQRLW